MRQSGWRLSPPAAGAPWTVASSMTAVQVPWLHVQLTQAPLVRPARGSEQSTALRGVTWGVSCAPTWHTYWLQGLATSSRVRPPSPSAAASAAV